MHFRRFFLAGLATLLPLAFTVFLFWFLVTRFGGFFAVGLRLIPGARHLPPMLLTLGGFVVLVLFIWLVGFLASGILGKWTVERIDYLVRQLPFVKGVYSSARQLTDAVFVDRKSLKRAVLAEYPRRGLYAIGFVTYEEPILLGRRRRARLVFFPTAPNPTTGWLAVVPEKEIRDLELSVDDALKLVVSGGVLTGHDLKSLVAASRRPGRPRPGSRFS